MTKLIMIMISCLIGALIWTLIRYYFPLQFSIIGMSALLALVLTPIVIELYNWIKSFFDN